MTTLPTLPGDVAGLEQALDGPVRGGVDPRRGAGQDTILVDADHRHRGSGRLRSVGTEAELNRHSLLSCEKPAGGPDRLDLWFAGRD